MGNDRIGSSDDNYRSGHFHGRAHMAGTKTSAAWKVRALAQSIKLLPQTCELYESLRSTHPYLAHTHIVALMPHQNARAATRERLRAHGVQFPEEDFSLVQDMSAAAHIEQQAQLLTKAGVTYRLTKSRLLYGHPMRYTWKFEHVRARSPKTAAALEKYVETPAQLCRRRLFPHAIRAFVINGMISSPSVFRAVLNWFNSSPVR